MNENMNEYRKAVYTDVANTFHDLRELKGLSIEEVARRAGMTPAKVASIERGNLPHNVDQLAKLAEAMGARLSLTVGKGSPASPKHCIMGNALYLPDFRIPKLIKPDIPEIPDNPEPPETPETLKL